MKWMVPSWWANPIKKWMAAWWADPFYIAVPPPPGHENVETMANPQPSAANTKQWLTKDPLKQTLAQTILCSASNCRLLKVGTWLANPIHQHLRNLCEDNTHGSQIIQPRKPENFQNLRKQVGWGAWLISSLQTSCPTLILLSFKTGQDSLLPNLHFIALLSPPSQKNVRTMHTQPLPVLHTQQCIPNHCQCCTLHTRQFPVHTTYSTVAMNTAYPTMHTRSLPVQLQQNTHNLSVAGEPHS